MKRSVVLACLAVIVLGAGACGGDEQPPAETPGTVTGVIVEIDRESLEEVNGFTLKAGDETYEISIADDVDYGFPLGHLQEHVQTSAPVMVELEERSDGLYALSIEDV
jgi:hypothetical protein